MRQIWPASDSGAPADVDVGAAITGERRAPLPDRPWVAVNMVASVDGASTDTEGRAGKLSGPADQELFRALRAAADVVLAGAGTIRAENYGPPRVPPALATVRQERGQSARPLLAVVSASLRLDPEARLFREAPADQRPVVLTSEMALTTEPSATAGRALADVAHVRSAGHHLVDWDQALRVLSQDFAARVVLVEGGPNVNGQLVARDLVDELCLTLSPVLLSGLTGRIVADTAAKIPRPLTLDRAFLADDFLLLRYLRRRDGDDTDHGERHSEA
jgi:riboflavin biosynthesis pyrimidine reductase